MTKLKQKTANEQEQKGFNPAIAAVAVVGILAVIAVVFLFAPGQPQTGLVTEPTADNEERPIGEIQTFIDSGNEVETIDGKPVIRLFSTTWCSHCKWIKASFDEVVKGYVAEGKIVAMHWEVDIMDDTLTPELEGSVPESELQVFADFNPRNSIPTFVFGGKYYRIGNGYESANDLEAEEAEFRAVIEALLQ